MGTTNKFALGIAQSNSGALPLFKEIGLKKYIAATSTIPLPIHLHLLGQERYYLMPGKHFGCSVVYFKINFSTQLNKLFRLILKIFRNYAFISPNFRKWLHANF